MGGRVRRGGLRRVVLRLGVAGVALAAVAAGAWAWRGHAARVQVRQARESLLTATVARRDLKATASAGGEVESRQQTIIACELENLEIRSEGRTMSAGGASTILTLVPEGALVKKGEVLCTLDSSDYEEMARTQTIKVERSRSEKVQADLNLAVARLAVTEFRDGIQGQTSQTLEGAFTLAESNLQRSRDRAAWAERMSIKGYISRDQLASDRQTLAKAEFELDQCRMDLDAFRKYEIPRTLHKLESAVETALVHQGGADEILKRQEDRLAKYNKQIQLCTIKAPHDGLVIYAEVNYFRTSKIETGSVVRPQQVLFQLPNLDQMQVVAEFHESIIDRVKVGMPAEVSIEGLPDRVLAGKVTMLTRVPLMSFFDVQHYVGFVRLDNPPSSIRPGMTAEVHVQIGDHDDVLAVPSEAVEIDHGRKLCYVATDAGIERREVELGAATPDFLEVAGGLAEGERVVLNPRGLDPLSASRVVAAPPRATPVVPPSHDTAG